MSCRTALIAILVFLLAAAMPAPAGAQSSGTSWMAGAPGSAPAADPPRYEPREPARTEQDEERERPFLYLDRHERRETAPANDHPAASADTNPDDDARGASIYGYDVWWRGPSISLGYAPLTALVLLDAVGLDFFTVNAGFTLVSHIELSVTLDVAARWATNVRNGNVFCPLELRITMESFLFMGAPTRGSIGELSGLVGLGGGLFTISDRWESFTSTYVILDAAFRFYFEPGLFLQAGYEMSIVFEGVVTFGLHLKVGYRFGRPRPPHLRGHGDRRG